MFLAFLPGSGCVTGGGGLIPSFSRGGMSPACMFPDRAHD